MPIFVEPEPQMAASLFDPDADPPETVEHQCPQCGGVMRYPVICRKQDLLRAQKILDTLQEYATETGAMAWSITKVQTMCAIAIAQRDSKDED